MSGSGGGGWREEPSNSCATLQQQTTLNSPVASVLATLTVGDVLAVRVRKAGVAVVVEAIHKGRTAGSITSSIIQLLAQCVSEGHEYVAEVLDVQGGACRVQVRHK